MSLETRIHKTPDAIPSKEWKATIRAAQQLNKGNSWYRLLLPPPESSSEFYEITVLRDGKPAAGLQAYWNKQNPKVASVISGRMMQERCNAIGIDPQPLQQLQAMDWFPYMATKALFQLPGDVEAIETACDAFFELCLSLGADVQVFVEMLVPENELWMQVLEKKGVSIGLGICNCDLDIQWKSMKEYFQWLGSGNIRREFASMQRDETFQYEVIEFKEFPSEKLKLDEIVSNLSLNDLKYGESSPVEWYEDFLQDPEQTKIAFVCKTAQGAFHRIGLWFQNGDELFLYMVGGESQDKTYFMVAFYLPIQFGIERNMRRLLYGAFPLQPKLARGAHLQWFHLGLHSFSPEKRELMQRGLACRNLGIIPDMEKQREKYQRPRKTAAPIQGMYGPLQKTLLKGQ